MVSASLAIETTAQSPESFDDAGERGVAQAAKTANDIQSVWVEQMQASAADGTVDHYRVDMKVTFLVEN